MTDRSLLRPKILFFTLLVALRASTLFRLQFFRHDFHLETRQYGPIMFSTSIVHFVSAAFWSYVADRTQKPKMVLLFLVLAQAGAFALFWLIPPQINGHSLTFPGLLMVSSLNTLFSGGAQPLMDRLCLKIILEKDMPAELYGRQRLFGSAGDMASMIIIAALVGSTRYIWLYHTTFVGALLFLLFGWWFIPKDTISRPLETFSKKTSDVIALEPPNRFKKAIQEVIQLLGNVNYLLLLFVSTLSGLARSVGSHYLGNFLEDPYDGLGIPKVETTICGISGYVFEMIFFFFSTQLHQKFGSLRLMAAAQLAMFIRWAITGSVPVGQNERWYIVFPFIAECFKGMSFGLMMAAGVMLSAKEAPDELQATAQGFFQGIYQGVAPALAGMLGMWLIDNDVPKLEGQSEELRIQLRIQKLAGRRGFFQDNSGLFRMAAVMSCAAFILMVVRIVKEQRTP